MKTVTHNDFLKLLKAHNPVRVREEDMHRVVEWTQYHRAIELVSMGIKKTPEEVQRAIAEVKAVLAGHPHIAPQDIPELTNPEQIREFGYDEKERVQVECERIAATYPGIADLDTGGYVSAPWPVVPRGFSNVMIHRAAGTSMRIIPANRYRSYDPQHFMVSEMLDNADEHGNKSRKDKNTYLLWHKCGQGREVYVVDEGEVEFDLGQRLEARRALGASFGKGDEASGIDVLHGRSKECGYFTIVDSDGAKKGTLVRMLLESKTPGEDQVTCGYLGHTILASTSGEQDV